MLNSKIFDKPWVKFALLGIMGTFFLISIILAACLVSEGVLILFTAIGVIANVLLIWGLNGKETKLTSFIWYAYPAMQFLFLLIASFCYITYESRYGYSYKEATNGYYACTIISFVFAAYGVSSFLTLLGRKKVWKVPLILLIGLGLAILTAIFALLEFKFLPVVILVETYLFAIALFALVYLWVYICNQFKAAAADKGYEGRRYFWIPFFLGLVGILLVIALPNKKMTDLMQRLAGPAPEPQPEPQPEVKAPQYYDEQPYQEPQYPPYQQ